MKGSGNLTQGDYSRFEIRFLIDKNERAIARAVGGRKATG
jgi:hypothetical protein